MTALASGASGGESGSRPPQLGRYELITPIGHGGMAEVQLALQRGPAGFEKLVVVKLVHENLASQKPFVDMLLDEARIAALVKHPNVVDIYDLGEADGRYFIAMEYLEGEPLLAVLRAGRDGSRLDVLSTARLIADTAEGLDAAHELRSLAGDPIELVHHDVSLGNIVVLYNGRVKLVDFGVAKARQSAQSAARLQGKYSYMAPEKLRGGSGDRRSDLWSLGCVLWEALTLRRLFKGATDGETMQQVLESKIHPPSEVNGDVPADLDPIVLRALERDAGRRYQTARAIAVDLEHVLRKRGYAAKNDRIAQYMQATFKAHIEARNKLVQQVSSKGRASRDVLEAAFNDQTPASVVTLSPTETLPRKPAAEPDREQQAPPGSGDGPTVIEAPALPQSGRQVVATGPTVHDGPTTVEPPISPSSPHQQPAPPAPGDGPTMVEPAVSHGWTGRRRHAVAAAGAAIVAVIAVASVALTGGDPAEPPSAAAPAWSAPVASAPAAATAPVAPQVGSPVAPPIASAAGSAATSPGAAAAARGPEPRTTNHPAGELAAPARSRLAPSDAPPNASPPPIAAPTAPPASRSAAPPARDPTRAASTEARASDEPRHQRRRPPAVDLPDGNPRTPARHAPARPAAERVNPVEVSRIALQAWAHGDSRTAIALYRRATQAAPTYAPAWRGLGLVYEKLGDRSAARAAFQRYLQLAPEAADAEAIRGRLSAP